MNTNIKTQKGYAILFTIVLVGIISAISIGLASVSYKQLILSSVAKDSQVSFYQADTASECGLYAENKLGMTSGFLPNPWSCGIDSNDSPYSLNINANGLGANGYTLSPDSLSTSSSPCFSIILDKTSTTKLIARGYNICNKNNIRTVEREINITAAP